MYNQISTTTAINLGMALRRLRHSLDLSQEDVTRGTMIHTSEISRLERGHIRSIRGLLHIENMLDYYKLLVWEDGR